MKITVKASSFLKEVIRVLTVVEKSTILPIYQLMRFQTVKGALVAHGSNTSSYMRCVINVDELDGEGDCLVFPPTLVETLKLLGDQVIKLTFNQEQKRLEIFSDNGRYKIGLENSDGFKGHWPDIKSFKEYSIEDFQKGLEFTRGFTSDDELRLSMTGVYVNVEGTSDDATFVATDGHSLSQMKFFGIGIPESFIIPKRSVGEILSLFSYALADGQKKFQMFISPSDHMVIFQIGNYFYTTSKIAEKFPDYKSLNISKTGSPFEVDFNTFKGALNRLKSYSNHTTGQIRMSLKSDELTFVADDQDYDKGATEKLSVAYAGPEIEIGFNVNKLRNVVSNFQGDTIKMYLTAPNKAAVIDAPKLKQDDLVLIMPVMLNSPN